MSLIAMADTNLVRRKADDPKQVSPKAPLGVPTDLVNQITRWIPTETITMYIALLALAAPQTAHNSSFTSRWLLFAIVAASNPIVVLLLVMAKSKNRSGFTFPGFEMLVSPVAFAAWALALPDSPLRYVAHYGVRWNSAIVTITTIVITLVANAFHKSPDFDQVVTKQQGADPESPEP